MQSKTRKHAGTCKKEKHPIDRMTTWLHLACKSSFNASRGFVKHSLNLHVVAFHLSQFVGGHTPVLAAVFGKRVENLKAGQSAVIIEAESRALTNLFTVLEPRHLHRVVVSRLHPHIEADRLTFRDRARRGVKLLHKARRVGRFGVSVLILPGSIQLLLQVLDRSDALFSVAG